MCSDSRCPCLVGEVGGGESFERHAELDTFVEPLYEALSDQLAAAHALRILAGEQSCFSAYARELSGALAPLMRISWSAKYAFDGLPTLSFPVAKTPQFWKLVTRVILGEIGPV